MNSEEEYVMSIFLSSPVIFSETLRQKRNEMLGHVTRLMPNELPIEILNRIINSIIWDRDETEYGDWVFNYSTNEAFYIVTNGDSYSTVMDPERCPLIGFVLTLAAMPSDSIVNQIIAAVNDYGRENDCYGEVKKVAIVKQYIATENVKEINY